MEFYRFKDLEITSSVIPANTHLIWETDSSGTLYCATGLHGNVLSKTTDKGDNWSTIDTLDYAIVGGYPDIANDKIYILEEAGVLSGGRVYYIDLTDDSVDQVGGAIGANGDVFHDIWLRDGNLEILTSDTSDNDLDIYRWVDPNWNSIISAGIAGVAYTSYVINIGTDVYFSFNKVGDTTVKMYQFTGVALNPLDTQDDRVVPADRNFHSLSYEGSNIVYFVLTDTSDANKEKIHNYSISGDAITTGLEFNAFLMLDRNCSGVEPNEQEKAFGITGTSSDLKVYQIVPRRNYPIQIQDLSTISSTAGRNIIAITDNFLMLDSGLMFEYTNSPTLMFDTRYHGGIIPLKKMFYFKCHPNDNIYFNESDFIKIYVSTNLKFAGLITSKKQPRKGIYEFVCNGMANEIFERSLSTTFTTNNTKEKLQYITTNSTEFCSEGTYDATATDWSYEYTRKLVYMFWLARFMERQVPYIEPDGEVYVKDYDGLTKSLQYYPGTYNFRDETVGTTGTSIGFVDDATDGTEVSIIASSGNHKSVLQNADTDGVNTVRHNLDGDLTGIVEFWFRTNDVTARTNIQLVDHPDPIIYLRMNASELQYYDGVVLTATGLTLVNNTWYHIKLQLYGDDTFDYWIDGTLYGDGADCNNNITDGLDRFYLTTYVKTDYLDAWGESWDIAYTVGDNRAAWSLNNTSQNVLLIDSKMLGKFTKGYSINTLNITRATVRYKDNATSTKPAAPTETFLKKALNDFVDPKIQASTEADQLAQNLYDIFSATTQFLTIRINGEGWLQPGETLHIQNTGRPTIIQDDFLIISVVYDPMHDTYIKMLLSDNIVTLKEYEEEFDTSSQQIHTASTQALENQATKSHIWTGTAAPTIDETDGVKIGDVFIDTNNTNAYICIDATDGAPDWNQID